METLKSVPEVIAKTIDVLSLKFGATTVKLFEIMVRGKFIESLSYTMGGLLMLMAGLVSLRKSYEFKDDYKDEGIMILLGIVGISLILTGIIVIVKNIVGVFAPDYVLLTSLIK